MTFGKKIIYPIMTAILALIAFIFPFSGSGALNVCAAASAYSDVLQDLCTDTDFNFIDYPKKPNDYSIQVIQIAESTSGELLIYAYQPSGTLKASSINISREQPDDKALTFVNYRLYFLNSNGVFFKYKVLLFELSPATIRYYNIPNILRPFDATIDKAPADGIISEMPNRVAQFWTVETVGESVKYSMETTEVVTVTQKVVGYCAYDDGLDLGWGSMEGLTKAYFVAFDTDRPIDKLISADLSFYATRVKCKYCANKNHSDHGLFYDFEDGEYIDYGTGMYNDEPLTITDKQSFGNVGGGNVRPATKFLKKRIRKTEDFIADENNKNYQLTAGEALSGTKWVLNFYEAQDKYNVNNVWLSFIPGVTQINGVADGDAELNNVYDVSILRLEFETDGKPFNLGVVDNKQSPGNKPVNTPINNCGACSWINALPWWAWVLLIIFVPVTIFTLYKLTVRFFKNLFQKRGDKFKKKNAKTSKRKAKPKRQKKKTSLKSLGKLFTRKKPATPKKSGADPKRKANLETKPTKTIKGDKK